MKRSAVFLDRDGVLNKDTGYLFRPADLIWIEGAREAVKAINDAGYLAFVVTNQSGIARGLYEESDVEKLHAWMAEEFAISGARIDKFEYCPHHPDGLVERYRRTCPRRKPSPGMITDLAVQYDVDLSRSILVGDKDRDLEAAHRAGIAGYRFKGGNLCTLIKSLLSKHPA
ncbi:HAD family hydrolase [Bradyrhizobium sp. ISRA442]|uniref:D-glycero-alpha-D-manno-heptose-1,7-bisphosphate 7-phosphatase n=1 Tax=Bradyrhizobium sp. ISRA442 TaxID=2866197 RepID=UPI00311AF1D7